jgi:hypothetical protein
MEIRMLNDLTDRQKFLLTLVIHEYIKTAQPIGSVSLVERFKLDMSPATVRNEMGAHRTWLSATAPYFGRARADRRRLPLFCR